jgi:gamma-glutamyl-gamma-aminobutyrate hydrolase PuuD
MDRFSISGEEFFFLGGGASSDALCVSHSRVHEAPEGAKPMDNKPLIAINSDFRTNSKDTTSFSFLANGYYDAVTAAGATAIVLPPVTNRQDLGCLLDLVAGVVMVGGADLNPNNDGLDVVGDSLMGRIYGDGEVRVNSMHHMAIDEVAAGFRVTARAPDGVIEAIESSTEDWFAFGTQFHPESHSASALDQRIFEEFVDGVRAGESVRLVA